MKTYLSAHHLAVAFSAQPLFHHVSFTLQQGNKIGLIGHNGCGKSSLLNILSGRLAPSAGQVTIARDCVLAYVEQSLPESLSTCTVIDVLGETLGVDQRWRAEVLLTELGFAPSQWQMPVSQLSGGQQMRLLLARAAIGQPDLLLLDEPSNHLDLPSLIWLETFLSQWPGALMVISHDQALLDKVTTTTWIMRDQTLYQFDLPCSQARVALSDKDQTDRQRHQTEQKEIDRIDRSARRLAEWGRVYDNEDLARKAKTMFNRKAQLQAAQTELSAGTPWRLQLQGMPLPANRLIDLPAFTVCRPQSSEPLFTVMAKQIRSGDRVAIMGANGQGKSTLLHTLYRVYLQGDDTITPGVCFHGKCQLGYYDQTLHQLHDQHTLTDALVPFAAISDHQRRQALIRAGFAYDRHAQRVASLSGGERARLLFVGLTLARYHLLFLDEPTNHLDMDGKEELIATLNQFDGGALIVSHDRRLIEQSCNRFWLIEHGTLTEYATPEAVYHQFTHEIEMTTCRTQSPAVETNSNAPILAPSPEESLLERLVALEALLAADQRRKTKHQKPARQRQWQQEIDQINQQLS